MSAKSSPAPSSEEELYAQFQMLRNEQRNLANSVGQYEVDLKEHKAVIDTLKAIDGGRKCYRMIGGVLCESNVKSVLPQLSDNRDQLEKLIENVNDQLTKKGTEINKFREEHNIRFEGMGGKEQEGDAKAEEEAPSAAAKEKRNVLVVKN